jgi:hypothetical protein
MIKSLIHGYARFRLRYPIYFFHHVPKCGGSSVRDALESWFHVNDDYYNENTKSSSPPVDLKPTNSHNCISGHFGHNGFFIDQRYPNIFEGLRARKRYRVFMFLRDPLEMRCSLYRHALKIGKSEHADLASAIMPFNNYYARIIHVDEENWKKKIDQYYFIGVADAELQISFDLLARMIGKSRVELPKINTTHEEYKLSSKSLSELQIADFISANALDYKIFNYVKARIHRLKEPLIESLTK